MDELGDLSCPPAPHKELVLDQGVQVQGEWTVGSCSQPLPFFPMRTHPVRLLSSMFHPCKRGRLHHLIKTGICQSCPPWHQLERTGTKGQLFPRGEWGRREHCQQSRGWAVTWAQVCGLQFVFLFDSMSISLWIEVYIFVKKMLFLINREIKRVNQFLTCVELKR